MPASQSWPYWAASPVSGPAQANCIWPAAAGVPAGVAAAAPADVGAAAAAAGVGADAAVGADAPVGAGALVGAAAGGLVGGGGGAVGALAGAAGWAHAVSSRTATSSAGSAGARRDAAMELRICLLHWVESRPAPCPPARPAPPGVPGPPSQHRLWQASGSLARARPPPRRAALSCSLARHEPGHLPRDPRPPPSLPRSTIRRPRTGTLPAPR